MPLITLTCTACPMEPVEAPYGEDEDPLAGGVVATGAALHLNANPGHELAVRSETEGEAATRRAEEDAAHHAEDERQREAVRELSAARDERQRRRTTGAAPVTVYPWLA